MLKMVTKDKGRYLPRMRAMRSIEAKIKKLQRGSVLATGLKIILMVFWQKKMLLPYSPYPVNGPEIRLKSFDLISLAEEISRQPYIEHTGTISELSFVGLQ